MRPKRQDAGSPPLSPPADLWEQRFEVPFTYPVVFTRGALDPENDALAWSIAHRDPHREHRCMALVDDGLAAAWPRFVDELVRYFEHRGGQLTLVASPGVVPGGEAAKNDPEFIEALQDQFGRAGLDRHAFVLIAGGGALLDAAGYAAATTHRGLRVVRMPSTVLAQNDAGIGVKNGINARGTKNYLGTFAPPWAVIDDLDLVQTLEHRDKVAGIAEAIKVGLIRDREFFDWLERHAGALASGDQDALGTSIRRCAELHLRHIRDGGDPFETGSARPLDFGHWAAHRLESLTEHTLRHGEAVGLGMLLDCRYATRTGRLSEEDLHRIYALFEALGLPRWHPCLAERDDSGRLRILDGLDEFREHLGGELTVTMLEGIGQGVEIHHIEPELVSDSVAWLEAAAAAPASGAVG